MEAAAQSVARTAVLSVQDLLGLDNSARMNTPAVQVSTRCLLLLLCTVLQESSLRTPLLGTSESSLPLQT